MLTKSLIGAVLVTAALSSNGTGPAAASSRQDLRQIPVAPVVAEPAFGEPGEELREEFHQTYPLSATGRVGLETSMAACRSKFGIDPQCRSMPSNARTEKSD